MLFRSVHLPWIDGAIIFDCGGDNADFDRINKNAQATDYKLTWSHWAFTKNAKTGEMKIYLNGQLWHSGTGKTKKLVNAAKVRIGNGYNFAGFYEGQIAEVRIWNKARTADEIKNSMYLQLTGQEVGLVGYWRLDAIVEEKERRVIDFSVNGNDGIVYGGAYVSAVTLNRNLAGTTTPAIKYENGELFAVSERGTYLEEFEFKTNNNVNPNNANGSNGKIFALTYKGKKSRYAQDWIPIRAEATEITAVGNNWYKASSRFTVPDGVSLMRSFGIGDIKGTWQTLEIRHHKVRLVSDSITETKYTDTVTQLTTLADNQIQLQESLKQLGLKEKQEALLLKEKRELQIKIDAYNAQGATRERIAQLNTQLNSLATEGKNLENKYNAEKSSPFNYVCHIVNLQYENYRLAPRGMDGNYPKMVLRPRDNEDYYHKWKFVSIGSNSYHIINLEYENYRLAPRGMDGDCCKMVLRHKDNEDYYHKWKLLSLGQQSNDNIPKAYFEWQLKLEESQRVKNYLDLLNSSLSATPQEKASWDAALRAVNDKISTIQTDLNTLNTTFINGVRTTQQEIGRAHV